MGLKKNVIYTSILTTSNYIFPLLVYPYVSRILGVNNIGLCNFIDNIINYFILISMMGINIMGNRQIAADKSSRLSLNKSFSNLFILNGISTIIALLILIICIYSIPVLRENKQMMWYGAIRLVANFMLIEWFYKGLEDFKFITYRTIFVKCLYVASIFIFVHTEEDYTTYYLLTVLMVAANAIINTFYSRNFAKISFKNLNFSPIIKSFFLLGIYLFVTSLCTTFNVVYLGFTTNDDQVGYYTTAIKLYSILLAFFAGLTSVIMPRMSSLISQNKINEFKALLHKTTSILFSFSLPVIILSIIFAPNIVLLISGPGYEGAITPMRIVMPLMLIIGYEQITVVQGLMPLKADKIIMINSSIGAIISVTLNILLVKILMSVGSAIVWVATETIILILSQIAITKIVHISFPIKELVQEISVNVPLLILLLLLYFILDKSYFVNLVISTSVTVVYTYIMQYYILKNPMIVELTVKLKKYIPCGSLNKD